MDDTIVSAIEAALSDVVERPVAGIRSDMKLDRDFDLDSFMFVQFLLSLEDKVQGLRFDPTALGQTDFNSVGSLASYISAQVCAEAQ